MEAHWRFDMIHGLDLSAYQPKCDWGRIYADPLQPKFGYLKASEGNGWVSSKLKEQVDGIRKLKAQREEFFAGYYHFCRWDTEGSITVDALDEAEHFFESAGGKPCAPGELPPAADMEWITGKKRDPDELVLWLRFFLHRTEELFECLPVIYTGPSFWQYSLLSDKKNLSLELTSYPLWQADYNSPPGKPKQMAGTEGATEGKTWPWVIHQYSGKGRIEGVFDKYGHPTNVDLNVFNGSLNDLRLFARAETK